MRISWNHTDLLCGRPWVGSGKLIDRTGRFCSVWWVGPIMVAR